MQKQKIGLFFGSFNPIHLGHLHIAEFFLQHGYLFQVWFVVSPQNPLKNKKNLIADDLRYQMVQLAVEDQPNCIALDVEMHLPKPSYTINTLHYLTEKYPEYEFVLLMGADNLVVFDQWKDYEYIINHYQIYVYPRPGVPENKWFEHPHVTSYPSLLMDISATAIRHHGDDINFIKKNMPPKAAAFFWEKVVKAQLLF